MAMNRIEEFTTPIRTVLQAHPLYTTLALSLGLSIYRWNSNRVGNVLCTFTVSCRALSLGQSSRLWIGVSCSEFHKRGSLDKAHERAYRQRV
jgi:hypothetical protein